jgi:hypothetical protein
MSNPENSGPVKLYTPKGAARAMLAGKTLKGRGGYEYFWGKNGVGETGFFRGTSDGILLHVFDFSDLWGEE